VSSQNIPLPQLIDSHCHLDFDYSPKSTDDLIKEATSAGLSHLITVGTEVKTFDTLESISDRYPNVFHTIGIHPHEAKTLEPEHLNLIRSKSKHPKCRAIGEIGLDYFYDHSPREVQIEQFRAQYLIAADVGLPIVIHARDAEEDLLNGLKEYVAMIPKDRIPGVIHCFTGTKAFGLACVALGFYISFSGIVTFPKSHDLRATAREIPLDRMLVETDSPFLAPVPLRGRKCEPSMVVHTAKMLAQIKEVSFDVFAQTTQANTKKVFKI
jgi:TatD DNase family protein